MWLLISQMNFYSTSSVEWNQYGHDYQKTRRAPLKCTSPANVNRIWTSEDSPGFLFSPGSAVWNIVYDGNLDGTNEVMGGGIDHGFFSDKLLLRLHPYYSSSNIFGISFGNDGTYRGLYTAGKVGNERRVLFTYDYDDSDMWSDNYGDKVRVINGWTGGTIWDVEFCHNTFCLRGMPTIIDIDNNGCPEVMFGYYGNIISKNLCDFSTVWQTNVSGLCAATVAVGKFSGQYGAVVLSCDGRIRILNPSNGAILTTSPYYGNFISGPMVVDVNNDGNDDIVFAFGNASVNGPYYDDWSGNYYCTYNYNRSIRAVNPSGWVNIWIKNQSGNGTIPAYCDEYGCYCQGDIPFYISQFATGRILPSNQLGIAYLEWSSGAGGTLTVIRADNGQTVASGIGGYYLNPSVADLNGDGIEGVIVSDACGNPKEHSYVNGWTTPVWSAAGCADEPPITSDLIVAKAWMNYDLNPAQGQLIIVEGDGSCFTNTWLCNSAEQITPVENWEMLKSPRIYYANGYLNVENYTGDIEIYKVDGTRITKTFIQDKSQIKLLKDNIYIVKIKDKTMKLVAK